MVVCHCYAVNDRRVRDAVAEGARSVDDVVARCGAGGRCGGCRPVVADLLAEALGEAVVGLPTRAASAA